MKIFYQTMGKMKKKFSGFLARFFKKKRTRIGIYGPPNAGKTTLANRIARDWTGDAVGPVSEIPHETRRARKKEDIIISGANGSTVTIDIVDTPGVTTKVDYHDFLEFGMEKDEAIIRAREATEGVAEAITGYLKERIRRSLRNRLGYLLLSDLIKELARMVDYSEYGGAPLLGIDGVCIICHGKSNERAIKNAVRMASEFVNKNLTGHIKDAMEEYSSQNRTKER